MKCSWCDGWGLIEENHGQGQIETLGCPDCQGTGEVFLDDRCKRCGEPYANDLTQLCMDCETTPC